MVLVKTQAGQQALKDRHGSLSSRQRSAFILFDGKRSTEEVLSATAPMGITRDDIQSMIDQGLLEPVARQGQPGSSASVSNGPVESADDPGATSAPAEGSGRSPMERYKAAYPIATELTAALGLRGFTRNASNHANSVFPISTANGPRRLLCSSETMCRHGPR